MNEEKFFPLTLRDRVPGWPAAVNSAVRTWKEIPFGSGTFLTAFPGLFDGAAWDRWYRFFEPLQSAFVASVAFFWWQDRQRLVCRCDRLQEKLAEKEAVISRLEAESERCASLSSDPVAGGYAASVGWPSFWLRLCLNAWGLPVPGTDSGKH